MWASCSLMTLGWDQAPQLGRNLARGGMGEEGGGGAWRHAFHIADPP